MKLIKNLTVSALIFAAFWTDVSAQTGLVPSEKEKKGDFEEWLPRSRRTALYGSAVSADLRRDSEGRMLFPEPGDQGRMNSCTAFATAYHLKSYMEAVDQGWEPRTQNKIFSPAFVYNQINGGQDYGSSIYNALELLRTKGCSTLQSTPYKAGDYRSQPSQNALKEAAQYKIKGFQAVKNLAGIKAALQEGLPIVAGITTDPVFMYGKFDVYGKGKFKRQELGHCSYEAHGRHAVIIAGYDDTKQALLLLNSWGKGWGNAGYGWISYDLINRIAYHDECKNFMETAFVAFDEKNKVNAAKYDAEIYGSILYLGLSKKNQPVWSWKLGLKGALNSITSIKWDIDPSLQISESEEEKKDDFRTAGTASSPGKKRARAEIVFKDGKKEVKEYFLNFQLSNRRTLEIHLTDEYIGLYKGKRNYRWNLSIDGNRQDINDIRKVTYHLQGFSQNEIVKENKEESFHYTFGAFSPFLLKADIEFNDGTVLKIQKQMQVTDTKTEDHLVLTNSAKFSGNYSGNNTPLFNWTLFITGPTDKLDKISEVKYFLHPTFKNNVITLTPEISSSKYGFPFSASGWGTFEVRAEIKYEDGKKESLKHMLKFPDLKN